MTPLLQPYGKPTPSWVLQPEAMRKRAAPKHAGGTAYYGRLRRPRAMAHTSDYARDNAEQLAESCKDRYTRRAHEGLYVNDSYEYSSSAPTISHPTKLWSLTHKLWNKIMHALTGNGDNDVDLCQSPIVPPGITASTVSNGTRMSPALAITTNSIADVCIKFECLGASNESSTPRAIREHLRLASDEERHAFKVLGRMKHSRRTILPDVSMPKRHQRKKAMPKKRAIPYMSH